VTTVAGRYRVRQAGRLHRHQDDLQLRAYANKHITTSGFRAATTAACSSASAGPVRREPGRDVRPREHQVPGRELNPLAEFASVDSLADANVTSLVLECRSRAHGREGGDHRRLDDGERPGHAHGERDARQRPRSHGADGSLVQVSRLGMPLVNEVVIGLKDKNRFNASEPKDDGRLPTTSPIRRCRRCRSACSARPETLQDAHDPAVYDLATSRARILKYTIRPLRSAVV